MPTDFYILGVRHHGPGSARSLLKGLEARKPDRLLIEGPADLSHMLSWLAEDSLVPPVALVAYRPDQPKRAAYFPLAVFSPEFVAIRYALQNGVPVDFFDLPQSAMLAAETRPAMPDVDPMTRLAEAAGYPHYERWWNDLIEQKREPEDSFAGILEMMQALREDEAAQVSASPKPNLPSPEALRLAEQREAHMRAHMRAAQQEGYHNVAVVCGAYHGPALENLDAHNAEADAALLADLPEVEVEAAWVPWSYSRMASGAGYGAGVASPGWYDYLWRSSAAESSELATGWLSRVATLLRAEGFVASSAHIIEAVRLSGALAALRDLPYPGLLELTEATRAVLCNGDGAPIVLINKRLIVGERFGAVPEGAPAVPLQRDLRRAQQELKLPPSPEKTSLRLDLREDLDLRRSQLLHRLRLLDIPWAEVLPARVRGGTFAEAWNLQWRVELELKVITANLWGNTVPAAAEAKARHDANEAASLQDLVALLERVLLAELPSVTGDVLKRIQDAAALDGDLLHLLESAIPLTQVLRYGGVRQRDLTVLREVVTGLVQRACLALPAGAVGPDDAAAEALFEGLIGLSAGLQSLRDPALSGSWEKALKMVLARPQSHGLLAGRCCRLLLDGRALSKVEATTHFQQRLSGEAKDAASWLDGFLRGSGLLLAHDAQLRQLLDQFVCAASEADFLDILPLLRRSFSSFSSSSRQQLSEALSEAPLARPAPLLEPRRFDRRRADALNPLLAALLGKSEADMDTWLKMDVKLKMDSPKGETL